MYDVVREDKILLKKMFDVTPISFNAELQSFSECENGFLNGLLGYIDSNIFQHCFELIFILYDFHLYDFCGDLDKTRPVGLFSSNFTENCILYCLSLFVNSQFDGGFRKNAIIQKVLYLP